VKSAGSVSLESKRTLALRERIAACSLKTTSQTYGFGTELAKVRTFIPSALESVTAQQK